MTESFLQSDYEGKKAWELIEPYWDLISIHDEADEFLEKSSQFPIAVQHLYPVWWCNSEVCNGGFHQFFLNSTGILAPEAVEGYLALGLHECAKLLEIAIAKFGDPYHRDYNLRHIVLDAIELPGETRKEWDPFYYLNELYYAAKDRDQIYNKMDEYAVRNGE